MTRYFYMFASGDQDGEVLSGDYLDQFWSDPSALAFARDAQIGQARLVGPHVMIRLDPGSVIRRKDGSYAFSGSPLVRPTP